MAYRLKQICLKEKKHHILLQNENGPCPLLAAANCLLLKGAITLPSTCTGAGVVTIDQLVNVLGEKILTNHNTGSDHHIQEVMNVFPTLQFGMDVNPKFTAGPTGVEYTQELNCFDLLHVELVHGWLIEPDAEEYELIGNKTYNQLINTVIEGNEAKAELEKRPAGQPTDDDLSTKATKGIIIHSFLTRSANQLTQFGLQTLHDYVQESQQMIFFRNNHFNTVTKHEGMLYLLVTDLGYANVPTVVWEKLDVIDGDTEYVTQNFKAIGALPQQPISDGATGEQMVANNMQSQADYQLALQLSREASVSTIPPQLPTQRQPEKVQGATHAVLPSTGTVVDLPPPVSRPDEPTAAPPALSVSDQAVPVQATPAAQMTASSSESVDQSQAKTTIAVGLPVPAPSQEDQDRILALRLQREEEKERSDRFAAIAAQQQQRQEEEATRSHPQNRLQNLMGFAQPPTRQPNTASRGSTRAGGEGSGGSKENCVIS